MWYKSDEENAVQIETFDFIKYLLSLKNYKNIVIKFDIEGSEYDILEKMILNKNKIQNIKHMFIEFHSKYMEPKIKTKYLIRENYIKKQLKKISGFTLWI